MPKEKTRLLYFKRGDVIDELKRLGPEPKTVPDGGTDHYIANFLNWSAGKPVLLMSYSVNNGKYDAGKVRARVVKRDWKKHNPLIRALMGVSLFIKIVFQLLLFKPTWIFCAASGPPLWACSIVSTVFSSPLVLTRHNRLEVPHGSILKRTAIRLTNRLIRKASAVIAHAAYLEDQLLKNGVNRKKLFQFNLSYGYLLDQSNIDNAVPDLQGNKQYRIILFTGRVDIHKGVFDLLNAVKERLASDSRIKLVYAGNGPDYHSLKQKIKEYKLENNVILLGHVENTRLKRYIKQSKFVVTPTHAILPEARCKSAVEAIVLGRPVIVPDLEPFQYLVKHEENGLLFTAESVDHLRLQINRMLDDDALYDKLKKNSTESGKQYLESKLTFRQALEHTYTLTTSK